MGNALRNGNRKKVPDKKAAEKGWPVPPRKREAKRVPFGAGPGHPTSWLALLTP